MADEGQVAEQTVPVEAAVEATATAVAEPVAEPAVVEPKEAHPLEPGGARFKEVYARAKAAESRMQEEREGRIRAEAEAQVLRETRAAKVDDKPAEKELSWNELKQLVSDQKLTEAEALDYREKVVAKRAVAQAEANITNKFSQQSRDQRLDSEIGKYKDAIPDVNVLGTDERKKFDTEFRFQVDFAGMDPKSLTTQLAALRAVYGPVDKAVQYAKARTKASSAEPYAETSGGGGVTATLNKTWKDKLAPHETAHYERMISRGRYGDPATAWDRVKDEIDFYNKKKGLKG